MFQRSRTRDVVKPQPAWGHGPTAHSTPRLPAWFRENLEHSLPILLAAGTCLGLAVWLHADAATIGRSRLALWTLAAALGVTLGGGGIALTLVDDSEGPAPSADPDQVLVPRAEWELWHQGATPAESAPEAPWSEGPPEAQAEEGETESEAELPAPTAVTPAVDPSMVRAASAQILAEAAPAVRGVPTTAATAEASPSPAPSLNRSAGPSPPPPPKTSTPLRTGAPSSPVQVAPPPPVWQEEPMRELESVLAELQSSVAASAPRSALRGPLPRKESAPRRESCVGCGASVAAYSEQTCIVCDRSLCDACLERSVADGRPAVCPHCQPPRVD